MLKTVLTFSILFLIAACGGGGGGGSSFSITANSQSFSTDEDAIYIGNLTASNLKCFKCYFSKYFRPKLWSN